MAHLVQVFSTLLRDLFVRWTGSVDRGQLPSNPLTTIYVVDDLFIDSFDSRAAYPVLVMRASGFLLGSVSHVRHTVMRTSARAADKRHTRLCDG